MDNPRPTKRPRRRPIACERCHVQKVKCSLGAPCDGCVSAKRADKCTYPIKDRNIPMSESYVEKLEKELQDLKAELANLTTPRATPAAADPSLEDDDVPSHNIDPEVANPLLDVPDGLFAGQVSAQPVYVGEASCTAFGDRLLQCAYRRSSTISCNTMPDHITHPAFHRLLSRDFQLPGRTQAHLLIRRAQSFIGQNYHLLERKTFFEKLDRAYRSEGPPDLLFICHLFAILALGELYSNCKTMVSDHRVPGTNWFIQAVSLLQDLYEVASIEQVQILLLLSFYANALGRIRSAHAYCGIALRLAIGLGLHRSQSGVSTMDPVQRETRRRVWWTLYLFDRMVSSKLGYPLGINDDDIDVEMPSMDCLSPLQQAEFHDPMHLCAHARLARITGDILSDIYCLPSHNNITFVRRVHRVLNDLRQWDEQLPAALRLHADSTARTLYTLHMQYHLCIIQTTRPILFHVFRSRFPASLGDTHPRRRAFSPTSLALAEACVQAARTTNQLLTKLFVEGMLAVFGYFDSHYLFSSTLILMISAVMESANSVSDSIQSAFSILRAMVNEGNISAADYLSRLEHIHFTITRLQAEDHQTITPNGINPETGGSSDTVTTSIVSSNIYQHVRPIAAASVADSTINLGPTFVGVGCDADDPLDDPLIRGFLSDFQWRNTTSPDAAFSQLVSELMDEDVFGM